MKKIILFLLVIICIPACKKNDAQPTSWNITFKIIGKGIYHWRAGLSQTGHVGNVGEPSIFTTSAQKGDLIELDAINDSLNSPISIEMDIVPTLGSGVYKSSGFGKQQVQYQN